MLLSFRFENHRSFRGEAQLNLLRAYGLATPPTPVVGVFGANASGKSSLIGALSFMGSLVGRSDRDVEPGFGLQRHPFRLDPRIRRLPSSYVVDLMLDGVRHTYGFTITDDEVLAEWLYSYPLGPRRKIFEREGQIFTWGERSKGSSLERLASITAPTALFLSVAARFGSFERRPSQQNVADDIFAPLHRVYSWLWQDLVRAYPGSSGIGGSRIGEQFIKDADRFKIVIEMLRAADLGLVDMSVRQPDDDDNLPEKAVDELTVQQYLNRSRKRPRLQFHHQGASGDVLFEIQDESDGTVRLLELATQATTALESGGLLLVDEIDASLHPLLTAQLVELFQSEIINKFRAQLIFTSHDATLLGSLNGMEVLQRDQIWFVEKEDDGASALYSLVEFKPRKENENRQRRYLSGKYGAIPDLSMGMFERVLESREEEA